MEYVSSEKSGHTVCKLFKICWTVNIKLDYYTHLFHPQKHSERTIVSWIKSMTPNLITSTTELRRGTEIYSVEARSCGVCWWKGSTNSLMFYQSFPVQLCNCEPAVGTAELFSHHPTKPWIEGGALSIADASRHQWYKYTLQLTVISYSNVYPSFTIYHIHLLQTFFFLTSCSETWVNSTPLEGCHGSFNSPSDQASFSSLLFCLHIAPHNL